MEFGFAPGLTEEDMATIERHHKMAEEIVANRKTNPAGYFKKEDMTGVKTYHPDEEIPESVYDRMLREGRIKF